MSAPKRARNRWLAIAIGIGVAAVAVAPSAASAGSADSDDVSAVFRSRSAAFVPQPDGTAVLELDGVSDRVRFDVAAPKGAEPTAILGHDADNLIPLTISAPSLDEDLRLQASDFRTTDDGLLLATVRPATSAAEAGLPAATLRKVEVTAEVDGPSGDEASAPPGSSSGSGTSYTIDMDWSVQQIPEWPSTWQLTPTKKVCVLSSPQTNPLKVDYPVNTGGRGWPTSSTKFGLEVDTGPDCFWKYSSMEFQVRVGDYSCNYQLHQLGPRTFAASATGRPNDIRVCDASGGINRVSGFLTGWGG